MLAKLLYMIKNLIFHLMLYQKQVVNGFIFNENETCENMLMNSWGLSKDWQFSQQIGTLCQIDGVLNELATDDLVTKIFEIVSGHNL